MDKDKECLAESRGGFICTLSPNHDGSHVAEAYINAHCDEVFVVDRWED